MDVSPKGCEIILFPFKGTDPDTQKRRKNWQLFSLIIMSRKCCPASAWFAHRQNTAAHQCFDFLFHDRFLSRPKPDFPLRGGRWIDPHHSPNLNLQQSPNLRVRVCQQLFPKGHPLNHKSSGEETMCVLQYVCELHPLFSCHIIPELQEVMFCLLLHFIYIFAAILSISNPLPASSEPIAFPPSD